MDQETWNMELAVVNEQFNAATADESINLLNIAEDDLLGIARAFETQAMALQETVTEIQISVEDNNQMVILDMDTPAPHDETPALVGGDTGTPDSPGSAEKRSRGAPRKTVFKSEQAKLKAEKARVSRQKLKIEDQKRGEEINELKQQLEQLQSDVKRMQCLNDQNHEIYLRLIRDRVICVVENN